MTFSLIQILGLEQSLMAYNNFFFFQFHSQAILSKSVVLKNIYVPTISKFDIFSSKFSLKLQTHIPTTSYISLLGGLKGILT